MKYLALLLPIFLLLIINSSAFSQCCAAGNPDSDDNISEGGGKNKLLVSLGYKYSYSDKYYIGTEPDDYQYIDYSYFNFSSLALTYGVTSKFRLTADIGYFFSKLNTYVHKPNTKAYGLGDVSLTSIYKVYESNNKHFTLFPMAKVTFPVGQFEQIYNYVLLPIDLQPSAGSFRYAGGLLLLNKFDKSKYSMSTMTTMEVSQRIDTERTNYKYGNLYNFSTTGAYKLNKSLNIKLTAKYQFRARASNEDNELINATGGHVIFLSPQIGYTFLNSWRLSAKYGQPIYKNMNGRQLTNKYMISLKLSKALDFSKKGSCKKENLLTGDFLELTLKISGTCESCKTKIEEICNAQKGVVFASWDIPTMILTIKYTDKLEIEELKKKLAIAGHKEIIQ